MTEDDLPEISLPSDWPDHVVRAILHLIGLAHYAFMRALGMAIVLPSDTARMRVEITQLQQVLLWRDEETALLHGRMSRIDPHRRPHYRPHERLNILELQAATGWSNVGVRSANRIWVAVGPHDRGVGRDSGQWQAWAA